MKRISAIERKEEPMRGQIWNGPYGEVIVMGVIDRYVMYRRPGCSPNLEIMRAWKIIYTRKSEPK